MTRDELIQFIGDQIEDGVREAPYDIAEDIVDALGDTLRLDPQYAEMSATLTGVGRFAQR